MLIILGKSMVLALLVLAVNAFPLYLLYFPVHTKPVSVVHGPVLQVCAVRQYGLLCAVSVAVLLGFVYLADGESLALDVSLDPEVGEEDEEEHAIDPDKVDEYGHLVFTVFHEVILRDVDRHYDKLNLWETGNKLNTNSH